MIAVDSNILIYAHRAESEWHAIAARRLGGLVEGQAPWSVPWPCVHEFLAMVTHPRVFAPPTPLATALKAVEAWMDSPSLAMLGEAPGYWQALRSALDGARIVGPAVHDARIAALCIEHGVRELWSADRDFGRFPDLQVRNPLV